MSAECRDLEPLFTPYVDGEAPAEDRAAVEAHVGRCPPCRDRVEGERLVRDVLHARRGELCPSAPAWLRARCEAHGRRPRWLTRRALVPLSLAATLALAVLGVFLFGLGDGGAALAAQISRDHVRCFDVRPPQAGPVDAAQAARDWTETRGWPLRLPPGSPAEQLELVAVRRCLSQDGGSAHAMYTWRGEPLSLYVLPHRIAEDDAGALAEKFGERAVVWGKGGRTYVVLSAARRERDAALDRIAVYMRDTAE